MPKQLYIPLPCDEARQSMVERQLGPGSSVQSALSEADMRKIVEKTAGYSGMPLCLFAAARACLVCRRNLRMHHSVSAHPLLLRYKGSHHMHRLQSIRMHMRFFCQLALRYGIYFACCRV